MGAVGEICQPDGYRPLKHTKTILALYGVCTMCAVFRSCLCVYCVVSSVCE